MSNDALMSEPEVGIEVLFARELMRAYGPLMSGEDLRRALGYPSKGAYNQAIARGLLPVPVFGIERRRGKFALTQDVANWLITQRREATPAHVPAHLKE
jgi:hypothetical protein